MSTLLFKSFQDYIKSLCIKHKQLLHNDQSNRVFVPFQSGDEINSLPNNSAISKVLIGDFTGRAIGSFDEHKLEQSATLAFIVYMGDPAGNVSNAIEAALEKAKNLMFDFYARIKEDFETDNCGPLRYLQAQRMTFYPIDGPILENHYGWEMNLPFDSKAPAYNPDNWND